MQELSYQQLQQAQKSTQPPKIIDVLPADSFASAHIDGAVNVPGKAEDFVAQATKAIGSKDTAAILYCKNASCPASHEAATKLEAAGFTNISVYKGGIEEYKQMQSKQAA